MLFRVPYAVSGVPYARGGRTFVARAAQPGWSSLGPAWTAGLAAQNYRASRKARSTVSGFDPRSLAGHALAAPQLSARMQHMTRRVARQLHSSTGLRARGLASAASGAPRPFRVLGLQQVAIGGLDKGPLTDLWQACTQAQTRTQSLPPSRPPSLPHSLTHSLSRTPAH